jgi:4-hydroxy-2-oxoheptanedioate aldolase
MTTETFREALYSGRPLMGGWQQMACPLASEVTGAAGFDWVGIDTQHGIIGYDGMVGMLQALAISGTPGVVRVSGNNAPEINRVLDAGAHGVIVPLVNTAEEAEAAARACRYPPNGVRSWGATRTLIEVAPYTAAAGDDRAVCLVMIETEEGVANVEEIAAVPGVGGLYIGPQDLAISHGIAPSLDGALDNPEHRALMERVAGVAGDHGLPVGTHTTGPERAGEYVEMGITLLVIHRDAAALAEGTRGAVAAARESAARATASPRG